jgi:hypothetical protein
MRTDDDYAREVERVLGGPDCRLCGIAGIELTPHGVCHVLPSGEIGCLYRWIDRMDMSVTTEAIQTWLDLRNNLTSDTETVCVTYEKDGQQQTIR